MSAYSELTTKKSRIAFLREMLASEVRWAIKGLVTIYDYQTAEEQNAGHTHDHNGVGFSGADSEILSSFAKQVNAKRFAGSEKQMNILFKKIPKYAKQLDTIAQAKLETPVKPKGTNLSRRQAIACGAVAYTGD